MKEKKYGLLKAGILLIILAIFLSWIIPTGGFTSSGFTDRGMVRFGLNDIEWLFYYGIEFGIDKIIFLLVLGAMYSIFSHINAYKRLVENIAKKFIKHKEIVIVVTSVLIGILTSFLTNEFVVLLFIPFIVAILNKMKLDKITILFTTFGSMLVGVLGATLGTDGLVQFAQGFVSTTLSLKDMLYNTLLIRIGILAIGLVLFNFLTLMHLKKNKNEESSTMFELEVEDTTKKSNYIPFIIIGILLFLLVFIEYTDWVTNFNIKIFSDFRDMVNDVRIGDNFYVFKSILGEYPSSLSMWNLFVLPPFMILFTLIIALCYRIKFNDLVSYIGEGIKKVIKPILVVMGFYALVLIANITPYVATIVSKILNFSDGFNLATMLLSSIITGIFHTDLAFTASTMGAYLALEYVDYINPIFIMFNSIHALCQFFVPTSILLGIGLTTLKVNYRDYLKHIWKFVLGMLICLLVVIILMTLL